MAAAAQDAMKARAHAPSLDQFRAHRAAGDYTDAGAYHQLSASEKLALTLIDARPILKEETKPATYIGVAHSVFGIPTDMQVYPWAALKEEKT
jgi:hypothetical protein